MPAAEPVFKKKYYVIVAPKGKDSRFVQEAYFPSDKNKTLFSSITWVTTQKLCSFLRNAISDKKPFIRTCLSVIDAVKK